MSFFEDASLVLIPSAQKTSKVYSIKPTDGTGDLTFTRSNDTATRVNSAGLIEKVRTNLLKSSGNISTQSTYWTANQSGSTTQNAAVAPDGTTTASQITSAGSAYSGVSQASISVSAVPYTYSCYLKAVSGTPTIRLTFYDGVTFHQGNFTITSEWVRYSFTFTPLAGSFAVYNTCTSVATWLAWGAQLETGDIATDYIATTSAAVSVGPVANVPRLDYLGSSCGKLLLEGQRTNLALYSEQFDNAIWGKTSTTITANDAVSPSGYQDADLATSTAGGTLFNYVTLATSTTYTASFYVKKGTAADAKYRIYNFNTGTNTVAPTSYISQTNTSTWVRVSFTFTTSATGTSYGFFVLDGASAGTMYFWGAQIEAGAYATSYIPTLGAAVTRGADLAQKSSISALFGATATTLVLDFVKKASATGWTITGGNGTKLFSLCQFDNTSGIPRVVFDDGVDTSSTLAALSNGRHKIAVSYATNDTRVYIDGALVFTDTSCTYYQWDRIGVNATSWTGYTNNTNAFEINQFFMIPAASTNAQLAELTTI